MLLVDRRLRDGTPLKRRFSRDHHRCRAVDGVWRPDFLAAATPELLAEERDNPWGGGDWHLTFGDCVRVILEEEWAHLRYVRQDLAILG